MMRISALDLRLGIRMLAKYRGLSAIAVISMAVAIAIGAGFFGLGASMFDSTLPVADAGRVVAIQYRETRRDGHRQTAGDFLALRSSLRTVQDLATFTDKRRNLIAPGRPPEVIDIAEMTASGFSVAKTPALRGRPLLAEDERPDAPPVLVISHDEWQRRFDGDPAVIGRQVRLGADVHTVVGVMPEGFHFPVNHRYWTALRLPSALDPGKGLSLSIFGRLAGDATIEQAQTELAAIGAQMAKAYPETHADLRPRGLPYEHAVLGIAGDDDIRVAAQTLISLLLVVVAVNVAVLVYARTAARAGEIAVRTALGATRARIVAQLFAEALVLSGSAALVGLLLASVGLAEIGKVMKDGLPYWVTYGLPPSVVWYVATLAVVAALLVGVLPALHATGRRVHAGLQQLSSRGSQMALGRTWTTMIVAQVAVAVAVLPFAVDAATTTMASGMSKIGYPIEEFLRASLSMEREETTPATDSPAHRRARDLAFQSRAAEVLRRLETDAAVASVTFATYFGAGARYATIEVDDPGRPVKAGGDWVWNNRVAQNFFTVLDVPMIAGRGFTNADAHEGSSAVIVDRAFAEQFFGNTNPLGRRVRYIEPADDPQAAAPEPGPWLEIVGVVANFMTGGDDIPPPGMYRALTLDQLSGSVSLAIRVRTTPVSTFAGRLREIAAAVDSRLQVDSVQAAADAERERQRSMRLLGLGIGTATASVLMLSAAGIYAMMSFAVVRRRREIGIRAALGANPRRILTSIFAKASAQIAAGVALGLILAFTIGPAMGGEDIIRERGVSIFLAVAAIIAAVGLLASLGPARQGLSIQPTEALREE